MHQNTRGLFFLTVSLLLFATAGVAQSAKADVLSLLQSREYEKAAKILEQVTSREKDNGMAWSQLGAAYYGLQQYGKAVQAYQKADELKFMPWTVRYNAACALALDNKPEEALRWLERAVESGFAQAGLLESDDDLKSLRSHAKFPVILEAADKNANPCRYDLRHRSLDFWVGSWNVFNPQGQQVGTNVIEKKVGDCLIYESWTSAFGGTGQSMNYFDPGSGTWKQNWVSRNGGIVRYEGEVKGGTLYFQGENIAPDGTRKLARVRLTPKPDDRIHHVIETSTDAGQTWTVTFDGTYMRQADK